MATRAGTVLQISILIGGALLLLSIGFFAGFVTGGAGDRPRAVASAEPIGFEARPERSAGAENADTSPEGKKGAEKTGNPSAGGPQQQSSLERLYDRQSYKSAYDASDKVGDHLGDQAIEGAEPAIHGIAGFLQKILPPPLAALIPGLTETAKFHARSAVKENSGDLINDHLNESRESAKHSFFGGEESGAKEGDSDGDEAPLTVSRKDEASPGGKAGNEKREIVTADTAAPRSAESGTAWAIRLGRFASVANAENYSSDLARSGLNVRVAMENNEDGRNWYDVRTVAYLDHSAASAALNRLQAQGYDGTLISEASLGSAKP